VMPSPLNRTLRLDTNDWNAPIASLNDLRLNPAVSNIYCGDVLEALDQLPEHSFDLILADPPYNYGVDFGNDSDHRDDEDYQEWVTLWLNKLGRISKQTASLYICTGWQHSGFFQEQLQRAGWTVMNRITWKRDKGRGAKANWKQNMEDIWFAVQSPKSYTFNLESVKVHKKVIAPYKENGLPKDWTVDTDGKPYRMTHPSNIWTDLTVPFWSMRENTPHPTQKPESLAERLILASSNDGDRILDLFSGSGTFSVVAKRLKREFVGFEMNPEYVRYALKRLSLVDNPSQ